MFLYHAQFLSLCVGFQSFKYFVKKKTSMFDLVKNAQIQESVELMLQGVSKDHIMCSVSNMSFTAHYQGKVIEMFTPAQSVVCIVLSKPAWCNCEPSLAQSGKNILDVMPNICFMFSQHRSIYIQQKIATTVYKLSVLNYDGIHDILAARTGSSFAWNSWLLW